MWILNRDETKLVFAKSFECKIEYTNEDVEKINEKFSQLRNSVDKFRCTRMSIEEAREKAFKWAESKGITKKYILYVNGEIFDEYELGDFDSSRLPDNIIQRAMSVNMTLQ